MYIVASTSTGFRLQAHSSPPWHIRHTRDGYNYLVGDEDLSSFTVCRYRIELTHRHLAAPAPPAQALSMYTREGDDSVKAVAGAYTRSLQSST